MLPHVVFATRTSTTFMVTFILPFSYIGSCFYTIDYMALQKPYFKDCSWMANSHDQPPTCILFEKKCFLQGKLPQQNVQFTSYFVPICSSVSPLIDASISVMMRNS
jgi:hypothetical protein